MRIKEYSLLIIVVSMLSLPMIGCSQNRQKEISQPGNKSTLSVSNPTTESIHYFLMGEAALSEGNYWLAYSMFRQAANFDGESVTIAERLLESLHYLSGVEKSNYERIIQIGEQYISNGVVSNFIYYSLALAYLSVNRLDEGVSAIRKSLENETDPYKYYECFLVLSSYAGINDYSYLEKALSLATEDKSFIYSVAQLYEYNNPERAQDILEKAYRRFKDQTSYSRLIEFYSRHKDYDGIVSLIENRLNQGEKVDEKDRIMVLEYLYLGGEYERIVSIADYYNDVDSAAAHQYIFLAAFFAEHFEFAFEYGLKAVEKYEYPQEMQDLFNCCFAIICAYDDKYEQAAEYAIKVEKFELLVTLFTDTKSIEENEKEKIFALMVGKGVNSDRVEYIKAAYYYSNGLEDRARMIALFLAQKDLADEKLGMKVVSLLIEMDEIVAAFQTLKKINDPELEPYTFIAQYYHILGKDASAIEFLQGAYHNEPEPSAELILALASLYEMGGEYQNGIDIVEKALPRFPNDPKILNWYGYILVTYTDRLQEAEDHLLRALELSPESQYIQDSVAWLYFKLGDYEKAMRYLKIMIEVEVKDTTIAYHAGMIYYKMGEIESALEYFSLAVNLNTDDSDVIAAQRMIDELEDYYE